MHYFCYFSDKGTRYCNFYFGLHLMFSTVVNMLNELKLTVDKIQQSLPLAKVDRKVMHTRQFYFSVHKIKNDYKK